MTSNLTSRPSHLFQFQLLCFCLVWLSYQFPQSIRTSCWTRYLSSWCKNSYTWEIVESVGIDNNWQTLIKESISVRCDESPYCVSTWTATVWFLYLWNWNIVAQSFIIAEIVNIVPHLSIWPSFCQYKREYRARAWAEVAVFGTLSVITELTMPLPKCGICLSYTSSTG